MHPQIENLKQVRRFLLKQIDGLTPGQINHIPPGFNNNIVWNLGHLICAQQSLCYLRAGQPIRVDDRYVSPFQTGTRPTAPIPASEIEAIQTLLLTTLDDLQADYNNHHFAAYTPSERVAQIYGVQLHTIDDALRFLLYHEGFHSGYIAALKRLCTQIP